MNLPQPGIFSLGTTSHYFLELDREPGVEAAALVTALASLRGARATVGGINLVVGFSPSLWRHVAPQDCPPGVVDFVPVVGPDGFTMPATQHDAWAWVAGASDDVVFDAAQLVVGGVAGVARLSDHTRGFAYHDSRELSGFVDGTENPPLDDAPPVALVPEGTAGAGASVVVVQRWFHDLAALHALPVTEQEQVFGRTKELSIELEGDALPADAHIARVVTEDENGDEREIFRRSVPIGDLTAPGLEFVGFTGDQSIVDLMLHRMVGAEDGIRDRLTRYSTPVTGSYYVVPGVAALRQFATPEDD